jgi:hypothetical protein
MAGIDSTGGGRIYLTANRRGTRLRIPLLDLDADQLWVRSVVQVQTYRGSLRAALSTVIARVLVPRPLSVLLPGASSLVEGSSADPGGLGAAAGYPLPGRRRRLPMGLRWPGRWVEPDFWITTVRVFHARRVSPGFNASSNVRGMCWGCDNISNLPYTRDVGASLPL